MPKYIRTKDTIFEVLEDYKNSWLVRAKRNNKKTYSKGKKNSFFVKQADTIEELCDEFDWKWNEKEFPYSTARQHDRYSGYGDLKRAMREEENYGKYLNHNYQVYGAIWTDKGLIYVAKMNEKGCLELL